MVEVTFTVSPRVRRIAGHDPDTLPEVEYYRQIFWSSGMDLPDDLAARLAEFTIDSIEVPPTTKAVLSVQIPEGFVIVFDPVTHGREIIAVKGEPTCDRQALSIVFTKIWAPLGTVELRPVRCACRLTTTLTDACFPRSGSPAMRFIIFSASGGRSLPRNGSSPIRHFAIFITLTRSTPINGSR